MRYFAEGFVIVPIDKDDTGFHHCPRGKVYVCSERHGYIKGHVYLGSDGTLAQSTGENGWFDSVSQAFEAIVLWADKGRIRPLLMKSMDFQPVD